MDLVDIVTEITHNLSIDDLVTLRGVNRISKEAIDVNPHWIEYIRLLKKSKVELTIFMHGSDQLITTRECQRLRELSPKFKERYDTCVNIIRACGGLVSKFNTPILGDIITTDYTNGDFGNSYNGETKYYIIFPFRAIKLFKITLLSDMTGLSNFSYDSINNQWGKNSKYIVNIEFYGGSSVLPINICGKEGENFCRLVKSLGGDIYERTTKDTCICISNMITT